MEKGLAEPGPERGPAGPHLPNPNWSRSAPAADEAHIDIARAHELERKIRHDLMAELRTFAEQAGEGGGSCTSGRHRWTSRTMRTRSSIGRRSSLVLTRLVNCLEASKEKVVKYEKTVCMAWTHLQPAEPTTLGYRFANYAQDLLIDIELLEGRPATSSSRERG